MKNDDVPSGPYPYTPRKTRHKPVRRRSNRRRVRSRRSKRGTREVGLRGVER